MFAPREDSGSVGDESDKLSAGSDRFLDDGHWLCVRLILYVHILSIFAILGTQVRRYVRFRRGFVRRDRCV
jgi:hypothetical protein